MQSTQSMESTESNDFMLWQPRWMCPECVEHVGHNTWHLWKLFAWPAWPAPPLPAVPTVKVLVPVTETGPLKVTLPLPPTARRIILHNEQTPRNMTQFQSHKGSSRRDTRWERRRKVRQTKWATTNSNLFTTCSWSRVPTCSNLQTQETSNRNMVTTVIETPATWAHERALLTKSVFFPNSVATLGGSYGNS